MPYFNFSIPKNQRRAFRRITPGLVQDQRRTIVAYGDASIRGTYRGNTSVPVKVKRYM